MDEFLGKVVKGLQEVFPDAEGMKFDLETALGELPEWDSMAAVNLQTYFQQQFEIEVPLELMADDTTLEEIVNFIRNPVSIS